MSNLVEGGLRRRGRAVFEAEIGDADFAFANVAFDDAKVTGAQIAMAAGKHPVENYVVLRHLASGELETLRPTETSKLARNAVNRFFVVEGGLLNRFSVEGLSMEWPYDILKVWQVKFLAGACEDRSLVLEHDGIDRVFDDEEDVDIGGREAEKFKLRKRSRTVTVIYGTDSEFELERRVYTTEELMAVFGVPEGHRLDLISADGEFREMAPGERLKVREGMEFGSHPPVGQSS